MKNKTIVIAGGAGFIGQSLAARWGKDNRIIILGRQARNAPNNAYGGQPLTAARGYHITYWRWDGVHVEPHWAAAIDGCDLVINLAGRSVNCRYNRHNREEILDSRVNATRAIGEAIRAATVPPKVWFNMASATIYRHAEDRPQDEYTGEAGDDFSTRVCKSWEATFFGQRTPFTRKIALRAAITLGEGGALASYRQLVRWGLGGRQGSGRQLCSWVHIDDLGRAIEWLFGDPDLEGAFNIAAPGPVTNADFMAMLRRVMGCRFGLAAPAWLLKLGAAVIGTETELVLKSRWVLPAKLEQTGFVFAYPRLGDALFDLLKTPVYDTITRPAAESHSVEGPHRSFL